jgi:hypothetical protein
VPPRRASFGCAPPRCPRSEATAVQPGAGRAGCADSAPRGQPSLVGAVPPRRASFGCAPPRCPRSEATAVQPGGWPGTGGRRSRTQRSAISGGGCAATPRLLRMRSPPGVLVPRPPPSSRGAGRAGCADSAPDGQPPWVGAVPPRRASFGCAPPRCPRSEATAVQPGAGRAGCADSAPDGQPSLVGAVPPRRASFGCAPPRCPRSEATAVQPGGWLQVLPSSCGSPASTRDSRTRSVVRWCKPSPET